METLLQDLQTTLNEIYARKRTFVNKYDISVQVIVSEFVGFKVVDTPYVFGFDMNWNNWNDDAKWNLYTQDASFDDDHEFYCEHEPDTMAVLKDPFDVIEALKARNILEVYEKVLPQIIAMLKNLDDDFAREYDYCRGKALQCFNKFIICVMSHSVRLYGLTNRLMFPNQTVKRMLSIESV
jgi:hypothetical protein